ncbi:MAG: hypothetical protein DRI39_05880 [Chloroflexi bacterium]|nr:MAG: hypothetical protein DRI39_05880 [Chloroflexota bacterium]
MECNNTLINPEKLMVLYDNEVEEISETFVTVYWKDGNATVAGNLRASDTRQLMKTLWALCILQESIVKSLIQKGQAGKPKPEA